MCLKNFNQKCHYINHINRKRPCVQTINHLIPNDSIPFQNDSKMESKNNNLCKYCNKCFSSSSNCTKHLKICKIKNPFVQTNDKNMYGKLIKTIETQNNKIKLLETKIKNLSQKKVKNVTNITQINNNFKTIPFGDEDLSFITNKVVKQIFNLGHGSVAELIKLTHFNEKYPKNSNIYISNIKDKYINVHDGKQWILQNQKDTIPKLIDTKIDFLEDKVIELDGIIGERLKKKMNRFLNSEDQEKTINKITEEIKLLLYNNKDIPLKLNINKLLLDN
jgi:hypothetical protein